MQTVKSSKQQRVVTFTGGTGTSADASTSYSRVGSPSSALIRTLWIRKAYRNRHRSQSSTSTFTSSQNRLRYDTGYFPVFRVNSSGNRVLTYVRLDPSGLFFSTRPSIRLRSLSSGSTSTISWATLSSGPSIKSLLTRMSSIREDFISRNQLMSVTCRKNVLKIALKSVNSGQNSGSNLNLEFLLLADLKSFLTTGQMYGYFSNDKIVDAVLVQKDVEGNVSERAESYLNGEEEESYNKSKKKKKGLFHLVRHLRTALSSKRNSHAVNSIGTNESVDLSH